MLLALALSGCSCDEDRPYTPFQVASSLPGPENEPPRTPGPEGAPVTGLEQSALVLRATGLPQEWEAFGRTLRAPKGTGFAGGVELPPHGGQPSRVLAWALPRAPGQLDAGGLFAIDERGKPGARIAKVPDFLPSGPDCELTLPALAVTSGGVSATLQASCKGRLLPGTASGAFILVSDPDAKRAPFMLRLAPAAGTETLQVEAEGNAGTQNTAVTELSVHVDLAAPGGAHVALPLRFVEKAGGLSRVADAPSAELEAQVKELTLLVARKKDREAALGRIDALRRWIFAVCQEAGAARISDESGRPFSCGAVKSSLDRLTEAAIEGYLYRDEQWRAIGEYARSDFYLGATPAKTKERWAKRIFDKSIAVGAKIVAKHPLRLGVDVPYPFASPLRYEEGVLYGLTASGAAERFASKPDEAALPESSPPPPLDAPESNGTIDAWPLRPKAGDGRLLAALVPSCDRAEVVLAFEGEGGQASPGAPLPLLAPRPCRGLLGKPLPVEPVSWQGPALLSIAAGEPILSQGALLPPERPLAWATDLGVQVWSRAGHAVWRGPDLQGLHHCVASMPEGAQRIERVACIRGRSALELAPVPPGDREPARD